MTTLAPTLSQNSFAIGSRWTTVTRPDGTEQSIQVPLTEEDFLYPQEEDRFMLTDHHFRACVYLTEAIEFVCRPRQTIKVFAEHRIDWQKDDLRPNGPDVSVFDNYPHDIDPYRATLPVVDEGAVPLLVIEVTSPSTRHIDLGDKMDVYHQVGLPHYIIVDMREDEDGEPDPIILVFQHRPGCYNLMEPSEMGTWVDSVQMWFHVEEKKIVTYDVNRVRIPNRSELDELYLEEKRQRQAEKQRAEAEKQRADELARELAELRSRHSMNGKPLNAKPPENQ